MKAKIATRPQRGCQWVSASGTSVNRCLSKCCPTGKKSGFTLIECICAMSMLVVIFAAFTSVTVAASNLNRQTIAMGKSLDAAVEKLNTKTGGQKKTITFSDGLGAEFQVGVDFYETKDTDGCYLYAIEPQKGG